MADPPAGHRRHPQQLLAVRRQLTHPGQQHLPQRQRQFAGAGPGLKQLLGKERVSLRPVENLRYQPAVYGPAPQPGQLRGQLRAGEPRQLQPAHSRQPPHLSQPARQQLAGVIGPVTAHHQQPRPAQRAQHERQHVQGGAVRPMQVLQHQQQRNGPGEPAEQAAQPLEQPRPSHLGRPLAGRPVPGQLGQHPGQLRPVPAGSGRLVVVGQRLQRLEQRRVRQRAAG